MDINKSPENAPLKPQGSVADQQLRTRDKVFGVMGDVAEFGSDTFQFAVETGGYASGRAVRSLGKGIYKNVLGLFGKPFKRAA